MFGPGCTFAFEGEHVAKPHHKCLFRSEHTAVVAFVVSHPNDQRCALETAAKRVVASPEQKMTGFALWPWQHKGQQEVIISLIRYRCRQVTKYEGTGIEILYIFQQVSMHAIKIRIGVISSAQSKCQKPLLHFFWPALGVPDFFHCQRKLKEKEKKIKGKKLENI